MQYNVYGGVRNSPYESARLFLSTLSERNWLPVAVATITTLWISLLVVNVMQRLPAGTGNPVTPAKNGSQQLSVRNASSTTGGSMTVTQSSGNVAMNDGSMATPKAKATVAPSVAQASDTTATTAQNTASTVASTVSDTTSGKGADPIVPDPVSTVTDPVTNDPPVVVVPTPPVVVQDPVPPVTNTLNNVTGGDVTVKTPVVTVKL